MKNIKNLSIIVFSFFFFINCSGGGGGGSDHSETNTIPVAAFTFTPEFGNAPLVVSFDASGSSDSDGKISEYAWDFGDGDVSEGITATHQFEEGSYTVNLTVTDNSSGTNTISQEISVTPEGTGYTVKGTIYIVAGTSADGDVNDIYSTYTENNDFDHAQDITNPASVGGYLNIAYDGEEGGRLYETGDRSDFYKVNLTGSEIIMLSIGNQGLADLDLYLYDESEKKIDESIGSKTSTESIVVEDGGIHYIEVRIYGGTTNYQASNYVLNIGQNPTTSDTDTISIESLESNFVPGEIIVEFKEDAALKKSAMNALSEKATILSAIESTGLVLKSSQIKAGDCMLLSLGDEENTQKALKTLGVSSTTYKKQLASVRTQSDETQKKLETILARDALRNRSDVENADLNYIRKAFSTTPNDPSYPYQWHYPIINLPQAWDLTQNASEVIVGVIDTGVLVNHPELSGQLVDGYDFIRDPTRALDGDGIDDDPDDPGDQQYTTRSSFHGTHVSGTIAAATNNNTGVSGIAWSAKIMPLRVLGKQGGTDYDIIQAVKYAAGIENDSKKLPEKTADIINLSFGGSDYSSSAKKAYEQARENGVIIVAAAGNDSTSTRSYPAAHESVISVSAIGPSRELTDYSNFGTSYDKWIDVAAPGGDMDVNMNGDSYSDGVLSIGGNDSSDTIKYGYYLMQGTSMASPHVVGVIALMKGVYPALTPDDFQTLLEEGSITDDEGTEEEFGNGIINAYLAVVEALELAGKEPPEPDTSTLVVSPSSLNFDIATSSWVVSLTNGGSGTLSILSTNADQSWIEITEKSVDSNKLGTYTISVDRTDLTGGIHTGVVTFTSSTNTVQISIMVQADGDLEDLSAGHHYITIVDSSTGDDVATVNAYPENGQYEYTFTDIAPGAYQIYAGTDHNQDGYICDDGEACGAYTTLSSPTKLIVNKDMTDLDFTTGFQSLITASTLNEEESERSTLGIKIAPEEINIPK